MHRQIVGMAFVSAHRPSHLVLELVQVNTVMPLVKVVVAFVNAQRLLMRVACQVKLVFLAFANVAHRHLVKD